MTDKQGVLVTTAHRGVFFGYTEQPLDDIVERKRATLRKARNVVYWPHGNKGFLGLASMGPLSGARIGPPAEELAVNDVTSVAICTQDAIAKFEDAPWSK